ncbi:MAG: Lrp/AsnC family transcriptional regulator [Chloroflexi bacterium]|nr:Lrp/AsnC family transcriptional regulator [Chloroflexota bacterium]MCL5075363.1 Lrp/AsnC family transcriptional regulator [Chloroflexota bacterium]
MLSQLERRLISELQNDLEVIPHPFAAMAARVGLSEEEVIRIAQDLQQRGIMRRYGAVLRHRLAGFHGNAMTCWCVPAGRIDEVGRMMASFPEVTHCYERPTYPDWPYNLLAMLHAHTAEKCQDMARSIAERIGLNDYVILFSTKEYKKIRVRYYEGG